MATKTRMAQVRSNDLSFQDISTILTEIVAQATGKTTIAPQNTADFVSVATTALQSGYDPVLNSIAQVLSRTIFSIRPYTRKFGGINVSNQKWGAISRKLQIADSDWETDQRLKLEDGKSVDQWVVHLPNVLETNFYGANTYSRHVTIFKDQLDMAFSGPDQFATFISMLLGNMNDQVEQAHESLARSIIANFIGGKVLGDTSNVIHLVTEFNTATGSQLTSETALAPDNFPRVMKWVTSRIMSLCDFLTERTLKYHINVTGKEVARHTPYRMQKIYMSSIFENLAQTTVYADVYHDSLLRFADHESVNFWQSIDKPNEISVKPIYMTQDGSLTSPASGETVSNLFGVIFDAEALGYTIVNQYSLSTAMNARGSYSNIFLHFTDKYWNDFTENGLVLLLD